MRIYTKTGDSGETGLFGGPRVAKDHPRIAAYGTVDELNATLGLVRTANLPPEIDTLLGRMQNHMFSLGAELASPEPDRMSLPRIGPAQIEMLESAIDQFEKGLPALREFILPGGTEGAAYLHLARTVCRRAERCVVTLAAQERLSEAMVIYLNRTSDLLFVLARVVNAAHGVADVPWQQHA